MTQARRFLLGLGLILSVSTLVSLYLEIRGIDEKYRTIAAELGRSFFQAIDTMREWNLDHGGLYMQASSDTPPNPYLAESLRSATTTDGKTLNMINHAQMTRLFSELLTNKRGIHLHISSLTPIRPDNLADAWEQHALAHFQQGRPEEFDIVGEGDATAFKYMAPLRLEERCLSCHPGRDDSPEQVRGGISVSFSYAPFRKAIAAERRQNLIVHITFFCLGIGLIALPGRKMIRSIGALQYSLLHIKRLEGFLPICARCKRIRLVGADQGDQKSWIAVEEYIADRTDAEFTHGLCPKCAKELYPSSFRESDKHA
jgi:hypothetical protein